MGFENYRQSCVKNGANSITVINNNDKSEWCFPLKELSPVPPLEIGARYGWNGREVSSSQSSCVNVEENDTSDLGIANTKT